LTTAPAERNREARCGTATTGLPEDQDTVDEVEHLRGGNQGDTVTGSNGPNTLAVAAGEDYVDELGGLDRLDGGANADVVVSRDGNRDEPVSCGSGEDVAIVDPTDRVVRRGTVRCELIDDEHEKPRPGWIYVHPRHCGEASVEFRMPRHAPTRAAALQHVAANGVQAETGTHS